ncbi:MAG: magnesium transporter, partial [Clostridia bacterium]|nr:magnesium transporter [Clostridia bacterium]
EIRVGFVNGAIVGSLAFITSALYLNFLSSTVVNPWLSAGCIAIAMLVAMVVSSLCGTGIPLIFKKLKIDPAVASGPLITTVNDMVAVCVYYALAIVLLIPLM